MDLRSNMADKNFRSAVRAFLDAELPTHLRFRQDGAQLSRHTETLEWQRILFSKGWGAPHWPVQFGGTGWTPRQRMIFDMECGLAGVSVVRPFGTDNGLN